MIVGGGPYHGAPLLAGMAAARMGVDLVHVAMPINAAQKAKWPSGLIYEKIDDEDIITDVTSLVKRCFAGRGVQSIVIGPGIGDDIATIGAVKMLIKSTPNIPKVIDADAIKALDGWPPELIGVVTPHQKELQNWVGDIGAVPKLIENSGEKRVVIRTGPDGSIRRAARRSKAWADQLRL